MLLMDATESHKFIRVLRARFTTMKSYETHRFFAT
jgi:hypothetical protein